MLWLLTTEATAHTSQQSFVLLLPTDVYITSGVATVIVTVLALIFLPVRFTRLLFTPIRLLPRKYVAPWSATIQKLLSATTLLALSALVIIGFSGTHDPLRNLLPLFIWTVFWMGLVTLHGVVGNLWSVLNPWRLWRHRFRGKFALPSVMGNWPGIILLLLFSSFALADTAPEDPTRLARVVLLYFLFTLTACYLFGTDRWLQRGECFSMTLRRMALVAPVGLTDKSIAAGFFGWKATVAGPALTSVSSGIFSLCILAAGSFDGLNETFWWLQQIGINPLEFPGRSAVVWDTVRGLVMFVLLLLCCFFACVWLGTTLANRTSPTYVSVPAAFGYLSVATLPIALAYHAAHFLTSFMVNIQYTVAALTDPLQNGRDLLGLGTFYVTTGFFNTQSSVKAIWLTQAGIVVTGHVVSILLSHRIALVLWPRSRAAAVSQAPLALFMVLYTLLGLWLLAAPRGA
jgi:hypothetical protein